MTASRCEAQFHRNWEFNPGVASLAFASKVNLSKSMSITRALQRGADGSMTDAAIGKETARIYELLWCGEYLDGQGRRVPVKGDISKVMQIIGLTDVQKALLRNYQFMSSRLPGTRQVRSSIRHIVFSSRIVYGNPVFCTVTPSERHSGLAVRLFRGRRNDPAFTCASRELLPYIDYDAPSLRPPGETEDEAATIEIPLPDEFPAYDLRRLLTARDPLCCVKAFLVAVKVILPSLYGYRMCPNCPHCATSDEPCMDAFLEAMRHRWEAVGADATQ